MMPSCVSVWAFSPLVPWGAATASRLDDGAIRRGRPLAEAFPYLLDARYERVRATTGTPFRAIELPFSAKNAALEKYFIYIIDFYGAGEGNRTLVVSLGSFCSAIELHPRAAE